MFAAEEGHAPVVEMLLAAGANKDLQDQVHGAARTQALPLRDLRMTNLVKPCPHPSLSPTPYSQDRMTALDIAKRWKHTACVALLEAANAP